MALPNKCCIIGGRQTRPLPLHVAVSRTRRVQGITQAGGVPYERGVLSDLGAAQSLRAQVCRMPVLPLFLPLTTTTASESRSTRKSCTPGREPRGTVLLECVAQFSKPCIVRRRMSRHSNLSSPRVSPRTGVLLQLRSPVSDILAPIAASSLHSAVTNANSFNSMSQTCKRR